MILGIGNDLVDLRRIAATLERFGSRFTERVFTPEERRRCERAADPSAPYARRFAAKEACSKALGTGIAQGVAWRDMGVERAPGHGPTIRLTGGAAAALQRLWTRREAEGLLLAGHRPTIHVTMTDEPPHAQAIVIISAVPSRLDDAAAGG